MKKLIMIAALTIIPLVGAHAKKDCTNEPKNKWLTVEDFKKMMEAKGYKIAKFKQPGTCYEIYGTRSDGKEVEIYFNPTNGSIVKEKIEN